MGEKIEDKIRSLLNDIDKEFQRLTPHVGAKFAIEQISMWQQKFNEAKSKILKENVVDATSERKVIGQDAEIDS
ncbi:hypothetical protein ANME2D_01851 [Candidatus Methanoperedens nitroreducens]|uniref:Uncharacterized protein n=1 Tax=Candidatus Methanoperedens nitratireducens TaxID=1392998 RepID=A0A062UXU3_9EURY|nr:hypothetical protein [Candidatus Methanoperedens nitroreducens]KCZ71796.1 hypothetical protein ANME2D_01851 [Candidatus Methanoperedens nitroreducens]MDJ1422230.1 hypothetical protein [Candidatus Methanoperedens sp.]